MNPTPEQEIEYWQAALEAGQRKVEYAIRKLGELGVETEVDES